VRTLSGLLGLALRDVVLTRDERRAMSEGLADVEGPATADTVLSEWIDEHGATLGLRYANELDRHFRGRHERNLVGSPPT